MHEAMRAQLGVDGMLDRMKRKPEPNIEALKNAVDRLCLAATQMTAGQRPDDTPDKSVDWRSPEIDICQYVILCEAVTLVLSGKLDALESEQSEGEQYAE